MKTHTMYSLSGAAGVVWMLLATPTTGRADLLGIVDSALLREAIQQTLILGRMWSDGMHIVQMTEQAYQNIRSKQFYKTAGMNVANMETHGLAGQAVLWGTAANDNVSMGRMGWNTASVPAVQPTAPIIAGSPLAARLATSSIYDGAGATALNTIGQARSSLRQTQPALDIIERDALRNDPTANGQVQVLNTIQAADVATARLAQVQSNTAVIIAEQLTLQSKAQSDLLREGNNATLDFATAQQRGRLGRMSQALHYEGR